MVAAETLANILIFPLNAKRCWLFEFKDLSRNERNMQDMHRIQGDIKGNEQKRTVGQGNERKTRKKRTQLNKQMLRSKECHTR